MSSPVNVSSTPIAFGPLPRQAKGMLAETFNAQPPFATAIDANFGALSSFTDTYNSRIVTRRVSDIVDLTGMAWTYYSTPKTLCDGIAVGDLRFLNILLKYNGATTLKANSTGNLTTANGMESDIGYIKDPSFFPGSSWLSFVCGVSTGLGTVVFYPDTGLLRLVSLSYNAQTLAKGQYLYLNGAYIPRSVS